MNENMFNNQFELVEVRPFSCLTKIAIFIIYFVCPFGINLSLFTRNLHADVRANLIKKK